MDAQEERTPAGSRRRRVAAIVAGAVVALAATAAPASAVIVPEYDPDAVAGAIIHDPAHAERGEHRLAGARDAGAGPAPRSGRGDEAFPAAVSEGPLGGFPTSPTTYGILSTGDVRIVDLPNDERQRPARACSATPTTTARCTATPTRTSPC